VGNQLNPGLGLVTLMFCVGRDPYLLSWALFAVTGHKNTPKVKKRNMENSVE
jgi:hypothetical protein